MSSTTTTQSGPQPTETTESEGLMAQIERLSRSMEAKEPPWDDETQARLKAERDEAEKREEENRVWRLDREIHYTIRAKLPLRHLETADSVLGGKLKPTKVWRDLFKAVKDKPTESVLLVGSTGAGKTTAIIGCAMNMLRAKKISTIEYVTASRFEKAARSQEILEHLEECDVLIIDELHRCSGLPDWLQTPLIGVIDARYAMKLQTFGSATVKMADIESSIGREVIERFDRRIGTTEMSHRGKQ